MPVSEVVELSRLQFAITALYHFLFVPLTLGLSWLLVIMESVYVMTGKQIYKDMTQFWGKLFGINFAMGVTTGLTLEFQFGTNWAYYSHYVGDIFGVPLAIEGLMAFFLESTFVGLFFFGWNRLSRVAAPDRHVPRRARLEPVGAVDSGRQRLDEQSGRRRLQLPNHAHGTRQHLRRAVQSGRAGEVRAHRVGRLCDGVDVRARRLVVVSAEAPRHRIRAALVRDCRRLRPGVDAVRDRARRRIRLHAPAKFSRSSWPPSNPNGKPRPRRHRSRSFGIPNQKEQRTDYAIRIPYALGLIATRSLDEPVVGLKDLMARNEVRIKNGMLAYAALQKLKQGDTTDEATPPSTRTRTISATACCSSSSPPNVTDATPDQIAQAAEEHDPAGRAAVLLVPPDGRPRHAVPRHFRAGVLVLRATLAAAGEAPLVPALGRVGDSAAVARGGIRLDRRRSGPPAVDASPAFCRPTCPRRA